MGRRKPGKQRRPRKAAPYTLQQLQPPGKPYEEWLEVPADMDLTYVREDPRLDEDSRDFMERLAVIGTHYGGNAPMAAILLDMAIDTGHLGILDGPDGGHILPLQVAAERLGADLGSIRSSLHRLHASGAFLIEEYEETPFLRFVAKPPESPGDQWIFYGEQAASNVPGVCMPNAAAQDLTPEQLSALMYMRAKQVELERPDAEEYGAFDGVGGPERAKELFAEVGASGWADQRGCDACPAAHLCSQPDSAPERD